MESGYMLVFLFCDCCYVVYVLLVVLCIELEI